MREDADTSFGRASSRTLLVETLVTEELHVTEDGKVRVHAETDYMPRKTWWEDAQIASADLGGGQYAGKYMNYPTWWLDPDYEDDKHDQSLHADYGATALLLQLQYPLGPWQPVLPHTTERFFTAYVTLFDSEVEERNSLARRRVIRTLFPQVTESPIYFYLTNASSAGVRASADQASAVGFDSIIISFGAGFDPSSTNETYIAQVRNDTLYCRSKGLMIGGYTLMQHADFTQGDDACQSPDPGFRPGPADFSTVNHSIYRNRIVNFLKQTTMEILETDGPYEGATCAVTNRSGFKHVNNSQLAQYRATVDFYRLLKNELNTYNTVPDPYWSSGGTNKEPMGYTDEWNRIPSTEAGTREYLTTGRMYLYDGTKHKPSTMGWLGFELSRTPSPMEKHLRILEEAAASFLGQGNVPCYRGPRLYDDDSPRVKRMWRLWVAHFKKYRDILLSDPVHLIRPSGRHVEAMMHVNASGAIQAPQSSGRPYTPHTPLKSRTSNTSEFAQTSQTPQQSRVSGTPAAISPCAFLNLFNPTEREITSTLDLPLYYAGVPNGAALSLTWGGSLVEPTIWPVPSDSVEIVREDHTLRITFTMAPRSFLWVALTRTT